MSEHRTWVEISLERIAANYRAHCDVVGAGVVVAGVVKADAYRHGAREVALRLEREGARWLAVSNAEEGVQLREAGVRARILVMGDFLDFEIEALAAHELTPVVHSLERLKAWDEAAARRGAALAYHLKLDTGMGRLGVRASHEEIRGAVAGARAARMEGLMTHFASAGDFESGQTAEQVRAFEAARAAGIDAELRHMASSAPVAWGLRETFGTMVRPGLALYGYVSEARGAAPPLVLDVKPALEWKARVVEVREMAAGAAVGYSARWRASRASRIAVIAAGYADGVPHTLSTRGHVIVNGRVAPMVGAVSMDLTTVDVTDCGAVRQGDAVTLIGEGLDAEQVAREAGVISYAVLCGIGNRVARVYLD